MKVCFAVFESEGIDSKVYEHFGSAKSFIIVDTDTESVIEIKNDGEHHKGGGCNPFRAFKGVDIDALVVGGIGGGALMRLNEAGVKVFQAKASTVKENLEMFLKGELPEFIPSLTCGGHKGACSF